MKFVIVTGMSGAGKSQAAKFLEDIGYYCIDNMPPALISKFSDISYGSNKIDKVALVIDIRSGELFSDFFNSIELLKSSGYNFEILFLDSNDEALIKRFKETRRIHPLDNNGNLSEAIQKERRMLQEIKEISNHIIDTSNMLTRELREEIVKIFIHETQYKGIILTVQSFGFKYGLPIDSDLVFDVRFIPNPYYVDELKNLTGKHNNVKSYVLKSDETKEFLKKLMDMLNFLIPNYIKEGKNHLVISIGCTGGKHRSTVIAEEIYNFLIENGYSSFLNHRDISK